MSTPMRDIAPTLPVAVIIPCFNSGEVVEDAVASVLSQRPAEIVIVNDGSTEPRTLMALERIQSPTVRVIHQENQGPSAARQRGLSATVQPYVLSLDADDELAPGALARMLDALEKDSRLAVVWGDSERIGPHRKVFYPTGKTLDPWRITYINELVASTLMRRSSLDAVGGWSFSRGYEDWDVWMSMAENGMQGIHIGGVTLHYRVDGPGEHARHKLMHKQLRAEMRARHPSLYGDRSKNSSISESGWLLRTLLSLSEKLPLVIEDNRTFVAFLFFLCEPWHFHRRRPRRFTV